MLNYLVYITSFQMIIFRLRSHLLNLKVLPPHSEIICLLVFLFATQIVWSTCYFVRLFGKLKFIDLPLEDFLGHDQHFIFSKGESFTTIKEQF